MRQHSQKGGTAIGFIIGLVIGLAAALAVAIYVTKVPTPFSNKNQPRSAEQDAAETQKNKDWNPNGGLQSKPAGDGQPETSPNVDTKESAKDTPKEFIKEPAKETTKSEAKAETKTETKAEAKTESKAEIKPGVTADPLGDLVKSKVPLTASGNTASSADPFTYFVQAGAFRSQTEANAHRAKLSLMGLDAKISEREQAGRLVYRVRLGPYDDKDMADNAKARLDKNGIETALVRVQR